MLRVGFSFQLYHMKKPSKKSLELRKENFENKLAQYGLDSTIKDMVVFDETQYNYRQPLDVAERLLVLLAISYTAYSFDEGEKVMDWLKKEDLWKSVSEKEKEFFRSPDPDEEEKQNLSWRFEGAYVLAWALGKVPSADPGSECNEEKVNEFLQNIPSIGSSTEQLFTKLKFRPLYEIVDEKLFYKTAATYFQNIRVQDKENTSRVHSKASFERYHTLAWLVSSEAESAWDTITAETNK